MKAVCGDIDSIWEVEMAMVLRIQPKVPVSLSHGAIIRRAAPVRRCMRIRAKAEEDGSKKKVVVVGAGWAGLGAAHHLTKQVRRWFPRWLIDSEFTSEP